MSCLITTNITHHIEILQSQLERMGITTRLIPPLDIQCLSGCASQGNGGLATYKCLHAYNGLHHLGGEFISGTVTHISSILHVHSNHWVSFVMSLEASTIFLGDSLHGAGIGTSRAMVEAMGIIEWWLKASYSGSNIPVTLFKTTPLPTAYQNDTASCSFFALNALAHYVLPSQYPLHVGSDLMILRINYLNGILDCPMNTVSE